MALPRVRQSVLIRATSGVLALCLAGATLGADPPPKRRADDRRDVAKLNQFQARMVSTGRNVTTVELAGNRFAPQAMPHLAGLPSLQRLNLAQTAVTDADLSPLAGLSSIQHLSLLSTVVGDDGLRHLEELTELVALDLRGTRITDAGLRSLAGLTKLTRLALGGTAITDDGLAELARLRSLVALDLRFVRRGRHWHIAGGALSGRLPLVVRRLHVCADVRRRAAGELAVSRA